MPKKKKRTTVGLVVVVAAPCSRTCRRITELTDRQTYRTDDTESCNLYGVSEKRITTTQPNPPLTKHSHVVGSSQFLFECRRKLISKSSPILLPDLILEAMQDLGRQ